MTSIIFARSGGPPAAAAITSAASRKYAGAHYRWGYESELFHILAAEVIEAVHCASGYAQRLPDPSAMIDDKSLFTH
jgi:hypothetical protein